MKGKSIGYYITGSEESGLGNLYCIFTEKDSPESIKDLYCVSNNNNFKKEDGEFFLRDIIIKMNNIIESDKESRTYVDENNQEQSIYNCGNYETYQFKSTEEWKADSSFAEEGSELYNCVITGEGNTEEEALLDCIKNKEIIHKIASDYYNQLKATIENGGKQDVKE